MAGLTTVRLIETSYIHNAVLANWIVVYVLGPNLVEPNHVAFKATCTPTRTGAFNPDDSLVPATSSVAPTRPTNDQGQAR